MALHRAQLCRALASLHHPFYRCPLVPHVFRSSFSLFSCMKREKKRIERHEVPGDIYKKGDEGWPVPGIVVPYEEPLNPEIIIDTDKTSLEDSIAKIGKEIQDL